MTAGIETPQHHVDVACYGFWAVKALLLPSKMSTIQVSPSACSFTIEIHVVTVVDCTLQELVIFSDAGLPEALKVGSHFSFPPLPLQTMGETKEALFWVNPTNWTSGPRNAFVSFRGEFAGSCLHHNSLSQWIRTCHMTCCCCAGIFYQQSRISQHSQKASGPKQLKRSC